MNSQVYPFLEKIRELLEPKRESLIWLGAQIDKSERWFYGKEIQRVELMTLQKLSEVLEFNFMEDYNKWRLENDQEPLYIVQVPATPYQKKEKKMSISFKISTTLANAEVNGGKVLNAIRMDCEKYGYEFDLL